MRNCVGNLSFYSCSTSDRSEGHCHWSGDDYNANAMQDDARSHGHASERPDSWKEVAQSSQNNKEVHGTKFRRRRVRFAEIDSNYHIVSSSSGMAVSQMPWIDHDGITGKYTGHVNSGMRPHGSGALVYKDGSAKTHIWENGTPVKFWSPKPSRNRENAEKVNNGTFLPHLDIGDVGAFQDMVQESSSSEIDDLRKHEFAFILRSNGQWTYAIVADRQDDSMLFVVDPTGSRKYISKGKWSASIRLVKKAMKREKIPSFIPALSSPSSSSSTYTRIFEGMFDELTSVQGLPALPFQREKR
eukprot:CAMPEP_0183736610 /NCGR_PEP_ID=MMETSP0737-20130205/49726_1 /TAXON_ID=385413 /ORGANISM="Thalassiosira miniscula, Strain CCMP1093" /LENGTH=299 /DNA_ID=CAMNT_0025970659 /DNA_START=108 /DNA_END=1007 /DNA_ORIENTATION=+